MHYKGAIFDMDGTLLNSMLIWQNTVVNYLYTIGINPKETLSERLSSLSMIEGAKLLISEYNLNSTQQNIIDSINLMISEKYADVTLKEGAVELLDKLSLQGIKMCIATSTDINIVKNVLSRLKIVKYFEGIITCDMVGYGKTKPYIYEYALNLLGTSKDNTIIFEDAAYAIKTAKDSGFIVAGIYDEYEPEQEYVKNTSDYYFKSLKEVIL